MRQRTTKDETERSKSMMMVMTMTMEMQQRVRGGACAGLTRDKGGTEMDRDEEELMRFAWDRQGCRLCKNGVASFCV